MDKKQRISWGVSFGSIALVAGMVSYLGLSNGDKLNNQSTSNQTLPFNDNTNQQSPNLNSESGQASEGATSNFNFGDNNSSQFDNNSDSSTFDNGDGSFQQSQRQFSTNRDSFNHRGDFDTTTGGT